MLSIVTGPVGVGKTSLARGLWLDATEGGRGEWAGFLSVRRQEDGQTVGYDALCLRTRRAVPLLELAGPSAQAGGDASVGRYRVVEGAFDAATLWGEEWLRRGCAGMVLDEVGRLELRNEGWARLLRAALAMDPAVELLLVVRSSCREQVEEAFGLRRRRLLDLPVLLAEAESRVRKQGAAGPRSLGALAGGGARAGEALGELLVRSGRLRRRHGTYHPLEVESA